MKPSPALIQSLLSSPGDTTCPMCQSIGFWDNRKGKKPIGKGPTFVCKNKDGCDAGNGYPFGVFGRDLPNAGSGGGATGGGSAPRASWPMVRMAYRECITEAIACCAQVGKVSGAEVSAADIIASAATLLIARDKNNCLGAPPAPPKPKPAPPPPEPEDQPDPTPDYDDPSLLPF